MYFFVFVRDSWKRCLCNTALCFKKKSGTPELQKKNYINMKHRDKAKKKIKEEEGSGYIDTLRHAYLADVQF
jgi:hypothetical protein